MVSSIDPYPRPSPEHLEHLRGFARHDFGPDLSGDVVRAQDVALQLLAEIDALKSESEAREHAAYVAGYRRGFGVGHAYGDEQNGVCSGPQTEIGWMNYRDARGTR